MDMVYNALIQPYFDYCCEVWDTLNKSLSWLESSGVVEGGGGGGLRGAEPPLLKFHVDLGGLSPYIFCTLRINLNNVKNTHKNISKRSRTFFRIPSHFQSSFNTIMTVL